MYQNSLQTWRAVLAPNVGMQLALDMQVNSALEYLPALLRNAIEMEIGRQLFKVNELIPQTRSLVPGHFQIDTSTLIELFIPPYRLRKGTNIGIDYRMSLLEAKKKPM